MEVNPHSLRFIGSPSMDQVNCIYGSFYKDFLSSLFSYLTAKEQKPCRHVCRTWRQVLADKFPMWRVLEKLDMHIFPDSTKKIQNIFITDTMHAVCTLTQDNSYQLTIVDSKTQEALSSSYDSKIYKSEWRLYISSGGCSGDDVYVFGCKKDKSDSNHKKPLVFFYNKEQGWSVQYLLDKPVLTNFFYPKDLYSEVMKKIILVSRKTFIFSSSKDYLRCFGFYHDEGLAKKIRQPTGRKIICLSTRSTEYNYFITGQKGKNSNLSDPLFLSKYNITPDGIAQQWRIAAPPGTDPLFVCLENAWKFYAYACDQVFTALVWKNSEPLGSIPSIKQVDNQTVFARSWKLDQSHTSVFYNDCYPYFLIHLGFCFFLFNIENRSEVFPPINVSVRIKNALIYPKQKVIFVNTSDDGLTIYSFDGSVVFSIEDVYFWENLQSERDTHFFIQKRINDPSIRLFLAGFRDTEVENAPPNNEVVPSSNMKSTTKRNNEVVPSSNMKSTTKRRRLC